MTFALYFSRLTVLIVLLAACYSKLSSADAFFAFESVVGRLAGVGVRIRRPLAVAGAGAELATVVLLALDSTVRIGLMLALALMSLFLGLVMRAVLSGIETECACFGSSGATLSWWHVVRNLILVMVVIIGMLASRSVVTPSLLPSPRLALFGVLGLFAAGAIARWDDVTYAFFGS